MNEFTIHPGVYATGPSSGLVDLLKGAWISGRTMGDGTLYLVSGFSNYNGGVRFYDVFRQHVAAGGLVKAFFAGSTNARLTSRQVVEQLLKCGVDVTLVNRKRLLHAKVYGSSGSHGDRLVVSSGNFTGPGMSANAEASIALDEATTSAMGFQWSAMDAGLSGQAWDYRSPSLARQSDPAWDLLYDEVGGRVTFDETEEVSMVVVLGDADTRRINAVPTSKAARGSQYFWLSKDCFGFFPALTIPNSRGSKPTYSTIVSADFKDIGVTEDIRVTFEAGNNLDFRFGTGPLRGTGVATAGDLAVVIRRGERAYEVRTVRHGSSAFQSLRPYATTNIGNRGKQYGYVPNAIVDTFLP